jgi:membrane-associated phospholipid phosphatase
VPWTVVPLALLVPVYLFIPRFVVGTFHVPELALDRRIPVVPAWSLVYGALYLFLIVLPWLVVHDREHLRRTVRAYLTIWLTSYAFFFAWPTEAPRPPEVRGEGFAAWGLQSLYDSDPPYNCFPSLHVAHSFVSAATVFLAHRGVGIAALGSAVLVAVSTLFTKQHWVADVVGGVALAWFAGAVFLRIPAGARPEIEAPHAPALAIALGGACALGVLGFFLIYRWTAL